MALRMKPVAANEKSVGSGGHTRASETASNSNVYKGIWSSFGLFLGFSDVVFMIRKVS